MAGQRDPILADKLACTVKILPKKAPIGPWRAPDGTTFPLGKPKGKAKLVKLYVPVWELANVQDSMRKTDIDSMGLYFQAQERKQRRIDTDKRLAILRVKDQMCIYGLTWRDLE